MIYQLINTNEIKEISNLSKSLQQQGFEDLDLEFLRKIVSKSVDFD